MQASAFGTLHTGYNAVDAVHLHWWAGAQYAVALFGFTSSFV